LANVQDEGRDAGGLRPLKYGISFICNPPGFNAVRFMVESRTRLIHPDGSREDYYQCASCKSEDTFAPENLFYRDNYDFLPIFGAGKVLVFRRTPCVSTRYKQIANVDDMWGKPTMRLAEAERITELTEWEQIENVTATGVPIVSQTEISDDGTGAQAIIECPVKTMNISHEKRMYQVDTGPVAFPDLSKSYDPRISSLSLAFLAFNRADQTYFILERPTPVVRGDGRACKIYHYSDPFCRKARNRLFAVGIV